MAPLHGLQLATGDGFLDCGPYEVIALTLSPSASFGRCGGLVGCRRSSLSPVIRIQWSTWRNPAQKKRISTFHQAVNRAPALGPSLPAHAKARIVKALYSLGLCGAEVSGMPVPLELMAHRQMHCSCLVANAAQPRWFKVATRFVCHKPKPIVAKVFLALL
eukprot:4361838-Amphidinium_carterae.1